MCSITEAVLMHSLLLCGIDIFHVFMIRRHFGIDLARPREHLSTPSARRCRLLCVFKYYFCHPMLLCRISFAGRVPCGIAATLSSVVSEDLAAVAKWRGVPGLGQ